MANKYTKQLYQAIQENPELEIIPVIWRNFAPQKIYGVYLGQLKDSEVAEYFIGPNEMYIRDDDDYAEMKGTLKACMSRNIETLTEDQIKYLYRQLPWDKAILVDVYVSETL